VFAFVVVVFVVVVFVVVVFVLPESSAHPVVSVSVSNRKG
jgi:hypothetical protein